MSYVPDPQFPRLCVFGDSIVWGSTDTEAGGWVERLKTKFLREGQEDFVSVYNCGISGETTADVAQRVTGEVAARSPAALVLAIGINDSPHSGQEGTPIKEFSDTYRGLLTLTNSFDVQVGIVGITNVIDGREPEYSNNAILRYANVIEDLARDFDLPYLNPFGWLDETHLHEDGVHPNAEGHALLSERILPLVELLIESV